MKKKNLNLAENVTKDIVAFSQPSITFFKIGIFK